MTKFLTNDFYCNLQSTIQCAFITVTRFQYEHSNESLYLYQLDTDHFENFFSSIRTITHDFLDLRHRLVSALRIEKIFNENSNW